VKKRNLKAIFLGLLARRRGGDKPSHDRVASEAPQDSASARSQIEQAASDHKAPSASAEAVNEIGDHLSRKPPGPPADWLAKHSSGPPPHWVERVRSGAPKLLQNPERREAGATAPPQTPRQIQPRPAPGPRRLQRPAQSPPLRLQRPALAPLPIRETEQSGRGAGYSATDGRGHPETRRQEPLAPSSSADAQKDDADNSVTICQIVTHRQSQPDIGNRELAPLASTRRSANDGAAPIAPPRSRNQGIAGPAVLPLDNDRRPSGIEPHSPTRVDPGEFIQSSCNSYEPEFLRVEPVAPATEVHSRSRYNHEVPLDSPLASAAFARDWKFSRRQNPEQENVARYPAHRETRRSADGHERLALTSGYKQVVKREEEVTKPIGPQFERDQRAISYGVSEDRWPALFEASPDDYFDDLMTVWHELSRDRRLAREQEGGLWNE
jgi:hypothetical protein